MSSRYWSVTECRWVGTDVLTPLVAERWSARSSAPEPGGRPDLPRQREDEAAPAPATRS